ncbi:hypothetical protein LCGC14_1945200 [marine sediment metagenome]|uniref:Uncharacterized protein n=1 Tax=marine sediment metagenome TaxID=412755 RepID=A0A0F9IG82_9ZZZZ
MQAEKMKWVYTFVMLLVTLGWAVFTVLIVKGALAEPSEAGILEASGTSVLLGALIGWNALVVQYWFRKKTPQPPTGS